MRVHILLAALALSPLGIASLDAQADGIREVSASARSVIALNTRLRYTTLIILPDDEDILDVVCGDKDFWVISATQNIAHVKPAKEGASTNLNLVTASGTIYSFLLTEARSPQPDLKVYVSTDRSAQPDKPKYYSAAQVTTLETELRDTRAALDAAGRRATETIAAFQQRYPTTLQFVYGTPKYQKPFYVRSIWHDGRFTYLKSDARELPAVYETTDGQPSLVNFQVQDGVYIVPKVLEQGYLALGKARLSFQQGR